MSGSEHCAEAADFTMICLFFHIFIIISLGTNFRRVEVEWGTLALVRYRQEIGSGWYFIHSIFRLFQYFPQGRRKTSSVYVHIVYSHTRTRTPYTLYIYIICIPILYITIRITKENYLVYGVHRIHRYLYILNSSD